MSTVYFEVEFVCHNQISFLSVILSALIQLRWVTSDVIKFDGILSVDASYGLSRLSFNLRENLRESLSKKVLIPQKICNQLHKTFCSIQFGSIVTQYREPLVA